MGRPKGAQNKPKIEDTSKPVLVEKPKVIETPEVIIEDKPKIIEDKPKVIIQDKPKIIKSKPKPQIKPKVLQQIKTPEVSKGIPKKYIALGLFGAVLVLAYFKKDTIFEKYVSWKSNRLMDQISKEGIESVVIHDQEGV
jgi:hypothetical protein